VGTIVVWTNSDTTAHDVKADNGGFFTPIIQPGGSASVTMSTAGSVIYHCSIHPGMVGTIVVN
jgi:plastocyanin